MANAKVIDRKKKVVDQLKEKIETSSVMVISDYRGVTVKQITELRSKLYQHESEFKVIKNTLMNRALAAAGHEALNEHLAGPVGILFGYKDPVEPLKALVEFIEDNEKGEIKAGIVEKTVIDKKGIESMSKLPGREVLIAKVVGGFQAPIAGLVNVLQGNLRNLVYALNAIKDKKGEVK